ncbi:MAG: NAD(P)-dependent glycerol-1-phosphate dehydrogenase [Thermoplasmata archaeon]
MEFEKFKSMQFPRDVMVGHGVIASLPEITKSYLKRGSVLIITGNKTYDLAGGEAEDLIMKSGLEVHVIRTDQANNSNIQKIEEESVDLKPGILIGVGGGSKIDITKKVAYDLKIPYVSVPTSPSHDGIASPRASIKERGVFVSEQAVMPVAIIADTAIMVKAPYRYLAAGAADVISNVTALLDWKLAHRVKGEEYSSTAAALSEYSSRELIEKAHMIMSGVEESVWLVTKQILASGTAMAIASSSRPASGSEHLFAHALEKLGVGNAIHGEQVAIGSVVCMYLHGGDWEKLASVYRKINLPIRARDYGIRDEDAIKALSTAHKIRPERFTILGDSDLSYNAAERALQITGIIG